MDRSEMERRIKDFALRIIQLVKHLPEDQLGWTLGKQVLRSGTSIGANYREAARAGTKKHFNSIMNVALREADETLYWLELIAESDLVPAKRMESLLQESNELVAILAASVKKARQNKAE